ncbi:MAG: DUF1109 domain-containing protein [Alphaproteobacteria bacterium]|nr:DUF1109 domain-containing protein [Alphaproteobacteria bacterium]
MSTSPAQGRQPTERLIDRLVADARPVRRLGPPGRRAGLWLVAVAAVATVAVLFLADLPLFAERARNPSLALEMAGALTAGITAVIAAFHLSLPDRSGAWALLPLPGLALWLAGSGYGCWADWIRFGSERWAVGESLVCLRFILAVGLPLGLSLLLMLRRACPLAPGRVAAVGGLGAAGVSAFLLQFFHPFDVTVPDLAMHVIAVALVVAASSLFSRFSDRTQYRFT